MSELTEKKVNKIKLACGYISHMLITGFMFLGVAYFVNEIILDKAWNENYFKFAGAIFLIIALYSLVDCKRLYASLKTEIILIFCFLVSALLLLLSEYYINVPIWLVGGIAAAALVNRNIGMLYVYFSVFHAIYLQDDALNGLVFHFVCATVICILIPKMKTWLGMLYMMIFTGALVVGLSILVNHFEWNRFILLDAFSIFCTYFVCLFLTMIFVELLGKGKEERVQKVENAAEEYEEADYSYLERMAEESDAVPEQVSEYVTAAKEEELPMETEDFSEYCDTKAGLLSELRTKKKTAYAHALLVGQLAYIAAEAVQYNASLAKAAGYYEKIGKIHSEQPEMTIELLKEAQFSATLIETIRQINEKTFSIKEAVVVAMSDEIISNYSFIRHTKKLTLPAEKIVDKTLAKKIFTGEYNTSYMTIAEYTEIRNCFVAYLKEQDKKLGIE